MASVRGWGEGNHGGDESDRGGSRSQGVGVGTYRDFKAKKGKVHSSFRIAPLAEVLGDLSEAKEKILDKIGFSGLQYLQNYATDTMSRSKLSFSFWLLRKLDPATGILNLGQRGKLKLEKEDVNLVLGLRCLGDDLVPHDPSKLEKNRDIIKKNLLISSDEEIDLETLKKVLQRDISEDTEDAYGRAFMTAVVIYAVSTFLAPKGRPPKVNPEIFDSIINPDNIHKLNWCTYVLRTLQDSSAKVKADLRSRNSSVCLDGCLLFLQIAYLDNINVGYYTTIQLKCPRLSDFSYNRLNSLINDDKIEGTNVNEEKYGASELRHPAESLYTMGRLYRQKLERLPSSMRKLPSESELEKVLTYIDGENLEQKQEIMRTMQSLGERLCKLSDKRSEAVKNIVTRWKGIDFCKERDEDYERSRNIYHFDIGLFGTAGMDIPGAGRGAMQSKQTGETSRKKATKEEYTVDEQKKHNVVDLTGSDDEDDEQSSRFSGELKVEGTEDRHAAKSSNSGTGEDTQDVADAEPPISDGDSKGKRARYCPEEKTSKQGSVNDTSSGPKNPGVGVVEGGMRYRTKRPTNRTRAATCSRRVYSEISGDGSSGEEGDERMERTCETKTTRSGSVDHAGMAGAFSTQGLRDTRFPFARKILSGKRKKMVVEEKDEEDDDVYSSSN